MKQSDYLFFDWICLLFACPDKDRTSQNGPLDPVFGPPRGRGGRQKWGPMVHFDLSVFCPDKQIASKTNQKIDNHIVS